MKIVSLGEVLWDILPNAEHLGGAPFNFALHARNLGHDVCFVSAVGDDPHGQRALTRMEEVGLSTRFVRRTSDYPTGTVSVTLDAVGNPQYQIHRPAAYDFPALATLDLDALLTPPPQWIYFGTLQQMSAQAHDFTRQSAGSSADRPALLRCKPARQFLYARISSHTGRARTRSQVE